MSGVRTASARGGAEPSSFWHLQNGKASSGQWTFSFSDVSPSKISRHTVLAAILCLWLAREALPVMAYEGIVPCDDAFLRTTDSGLAFIPYFSTWAWLQLHYAQNNGNVSGGIAAYKDAFD